MTYDSRYPSTLSTENATHRSRNPPKRQTVCRFGGLFCSALKSSLQHKTVCRFGGVLVDQNVKQFVVLVEIHQNDKLTFKLTT